MAEEPKKGAFRQLLSGLGKIISGGFSLYLIWVVYSTFFGDGIPRSPQSLPPRPAVTESCQQVSRLFSASSQHSDLQKKELFKTRYVGAPFRWKLKVNEVDKSFGQLVVTTKCIPSESLIVDVMFTMDPVQKDTALSLIKGKTYEFMGVLEDFSDLTGLSARFTGVK